MSDAQMIPDDEIIPANHTQQHHQCNSNGQLGSLGGSSSRRDIPGKAVDNAGNVNGSMSIDDETMGDVMRDANVTDQTKEMAKAQRQPSLNIDRLCGGSGIRIDRRKYND